MKRLFSKILGLFLIVLITVGTLGLTVSKHNCGGKVVKRAIAFSKSDVDCGMAKKATKCPRHKGITKGCCSNSYQLIKVSEVFEEISSFELVQISKVVVSPVLLEVKKDVAFNVFIVFDNHDFRRVRHRIFVLICSFLV
ncbi:hypothetical protein KFE94_12055 [bacterium SCSIO 12643]|nr:hypothetical protein KFE94_12055 [bacterium SCSIO 12643]